jgi:hypothetical protein
MIVQQTQELIQQQAEAEMMQQQADAQPPEEPIQ